jgi:DNA segregation ATPase FtsK/SpoIIIE-like protein
MKLKKRDYGSLGTFFLILGISLYYVFHLSFLAVPLIILGLICHIVDFFFEPEQEKIIFTEIHKQEKDDEELYDKALLIVKEAGKASTSYLQRKLNINYTQAARLIDMLEERGIISSGSGVKPREML